MPRFSTPHQYVQRLTIVLNIGVFHSSISDKHVPCFLDYHCLPILHAYATNFLLENVFYYLFYEFLFMK